jgi:hypothetical protein
MDALAGSPLVSAWQAAKLQRGELGTTLDALGRSGLVNPLSCPARITTPSTVGLAAAVMGWDWVPARAWQLRVIR